MTFRCDHKKAFMLERCKEVFKNPEDVTEWLKTESVALGGKTPLELMESDVGIEMILNELGRIEHGIVS